MTPNLFRSLLLLVALTVCAFAQRGELPTGRVRDGNPEAYNVTHTLYGDFKVDETRARDGKTANFQLLLYDPGGIVIRRQNISVNGRYYFYGLINAEYTVAVESEGREVVRLPVMIMSNYKTDIQRDIELEWRDSGLAAKSGKAAPAANVIYARSVENQKLYDKAQELIAKRDHKQASAILDRIVKADARDYPSWMSLGTLQAMEGRNPEAETAFRGALAAKPDLKAALLSLGKVQMLQNSYEAAIDTLTRTVEADPKSPEANYLLGESYLQIKKGSKAVGYLNEAIKLDPIGMADAHLRLGVLYRGAGLKEKAVAEFEQLLAKRPDHPEKEKLQAYINENKPR
ncbi:MAG: tetratricopeptide repeat protein [Blastocatellia bacterium]|nr:tetratricopeptide repeat protein [Blastocatellia bacterium]